MSRRPEVHGLLDRMARLVGIHHIGLDRLGCAAVHRYPLGQCCEPVARRATSATAAFRGGQFPRRCRTDPAGRAGYQRDGARQTHSHLPVPLVAINLGANLPSR
jgi:hypothetical protein